MSGFRLTSLSGNRKPVPSIDSGQALSFAEQSAIQTRNIPPNVWVRADGVIDDKHPSVVMSRPKSRSAA